jgi:hypothetical protein
MSEVRYTTRPDGPTLSRARAEVDEVLVVVPAATARAASPAARQHLAAAAGLPVRAVRALADADLPIVIERCRNAGDAHRASEAFLSNAGVSSTVLAANPASWLPVLGAAAGIVVAALATLLWNTLALRAVPVLLVVAVLYGARALAVPSDEPARASIRRGVESIADAPEAWQAILQLRRHSLATDLPIQAQVDLWTALERLEEDLASGRLTPDQAIEAARSAGAALAPTAAASTAPDLRRTAEAARRARDDTSA